MFSRDFIKVIAPSSKEPKIVSAKFNAIICLVGNFGDMEN